MSALLVLSMNSLSASAFPSAENYMNKYISRAQRDYLIAGNFIAQYNAGLKAMYMARVEAYYDMSLSSYLTSFFVQTDERNTINGINQAEKQILERLAILQNNTWEQWRWSAAKYSTIILATYCLTKWSHMASDAKIVSTIAEIASGVSEIAVAVKQS